MTHEKISIRRWTEDDWEALKSIRIEAVTGYSHVFLNNAETTMSYADDHWKGMLRDAYNDAIFGLYDGDTVIGLTGAFRWRESPSDTVILGMSYVRESYRGRHLSDLFYQARLDWAWAQDGITRVIVSHKEGNMASKAANQRWGFQFYDTAMETYGDGSTAMNYKYELRRDLK